MIPKLAKIPEKLVMYRWHILDDLSWNYPIKHLFLLATITMITEKMYFTHFIAAVVRKTYSFIKMMQLISEKYNWENGAKQIQIIEENLSQSCVLCQLLRIKTLASGLKCIKHFSLFLLLFALYLLSGCDLFNMSSLS